MDALAAEGIPGSDIELEVVSDISPLSETWRHLQQATSAGLFQTWRWQSTWYECVGQYANIRPSIILIKRKSQPVGLIPLSVGRNKGLREATWFAGPFLDVGRPLILKEIMTPELWSGRGGIWDRAIRLLGVDVLKLDNVPEDFQSYVRRQSVAGRWEEWDPTFCVALDPWREASTSASAVSSRARKALRRKRRRLEEHGPVKLMVAQTLSEAETVVDTLFLQKRHQMEGRAARGVYENDKYREFLLRLWEDSNSTSFSHLSILTVGDQSLSAHFGVIHGHRFYSLQPSMSPGPLARYSPGLIHLHELLHWAASQGLEQFDLGPGDDELKRSLTKSPRPLYRWIDAPSNLGTFALVLRNLKVSHPRWLSFV